MQTQTVFNTDTGSLFVCHLLPQNQTLKIHVPYCKKWCNRRYNPNHQVYYPADPYQRCLPQRCTSTPVYHLSKCCCRSGCDRNLHQELKLQPLLLLPLRHFPVPKRNLTYRKTLHKKQIEILVRKTTSAFADKYLRCKDAVFHSLWCVYVWRCSFCAGL